MMRAFDLGDEGPLFYLGEFPVRFITLLVALHCIAMIAASLLMASGYGGLLDLLSYSSTAVSHGQVWRLFTYAFVAGPSIWFLFEMLMLYYFGREVENGLGWRRFAVLYTGLLLLGPCLLQAFGYAGRPQVFTGAQEVNFAVFAAFVAMHPGAQFFFGMAARWVFVGLLAISSLQLLAAQQPSRVLVLVASSILAVVLMRRAGFVEPLFGFSFSMRWSFPGLRRSGPKFSVLSGGLSPKGKEIAQEGSPAVVQSTPSGVESVTESAEREMDRLLEKIGKHGMASLTSSERQSLEEARQVILQRGGGV